jgi:Uncharacterized conserved protein
VIDDAGRTRPLREVTIDLVAELLPIAERLDCVDDLREVLVILDEGASYQRQRALLATGGNLEDIVVAAREELLAEIDSGGQSAR